jgi:hypothetical protein
MAEISDLIAEMMQKRDELRLKLHLGSKDAKDEWEDLTAEWDKFLSAAQFDKSSEEVGEAAKQLGLQMKEAYDRFKKALD